MNRSFALLIIVLALALFVSACGGQPANVNVDEFIIRQTEATLSAGEAIPVPTGDVILTVTGKIGAPNVDDTIQMDLETIESLGVVSHKVNVPEFIDSREIEYKGVLLSDLVALWQVPDDATIMEMVAINDYKVEVPLTDPKDYPVIFALQEDGVYMTIETRGPAMLVYPYDHYDFARDVYDNRWIWQIKSINIK